MSQNIFCDESVYGKGNNPGAKSLEKQAFGEGDCYSTVTAGFKVWRSSLVTGPLSLAARAARERKTQIDGTMFLREDRKNI
jgi:hypothetical protein